MKTLCLFYEAVHHLSALLYEASVKVASGLIGNASPFYYISDALQKLFSDLLSSVIRCGSDQNMLHCTAGSFKQLFHHQR